LHELEIDHYFEETMPNESLLPLFERAKELGIGFYLGYREKSGKAHYNSSILVDKEGEIIAKYRKSHVGGSLEPVKERKVQYMERRYILPGDSGFQVYSAFGGQVGMGICYDRRFPEFWRVMGMKGAELILLGFFSGGSSPNYGSYLGALHHLLALQAGAYWSGAWVIASAHCGMANSVIVSPSGEIIAKTYSVEDELINAVIDLDYSKKMPHFSPKANSINCNFVRDRRPELYKILTDEKWEGA
jgi:predicted amidohydrolase